jgi:hypothetical protein
MPPLQPDPRLPAIQTAKFLFPRPRNILYTIICVQYCIEGLCVTLCVFLWCVCTINRQSVNRESTHTHKFVLSETQVITYEHALKIVLSKFLHTTLTAPPPPPLPLTQSHTHITDNMAALDGHLWTCTANSYGLPKP